MPIEPVKIPQNVYIEDRIIGPLTLRQIIITMLGVGFSYAVWASIAKVYGYVPWHITVIVWTPAAIAAMFAFVRINDLSMTHLLLLLIERVSKPQTRVYGPRRGITVNARSFAPPPQNSRKVSARPQVDGQIDELSAFLDHETPPTGEDDIQAAPAPEPAQGSSIPARPVDKNRIKVSPLLADLDDLGDAEGGKVFHDVFHPPASHA